MYAIYGNIYHQYTPNVSIYTSTMDPMGMCMCLVMFVVHILKALVARLISISNISIEFQPKNRS